MRGFTIIETLIALGLAGLVVSLGVLVYRLFIQTHSSHQQQISLTYDGSIVESRLRKDASKAFRYELAYERLTLFDRKGDVLYEYSLQDSFLLRKRPEATDSLPFVGAWDRGPNNSFFLQDQRLNMRYAFRLPVQGRVE